MTNPNTPALPTPWKIDYRFPEGDASMPSICTDDEAEIVICRMVKYSGSTLANAALIVQAVNGRAELLAEIDNLRYIGGIQLELSTERLRQIDALKSQVEELAKALGFYAEIGNFLVCDNKFLELGERNHDLQGTQILGHKALAALAKIAT